MQVMGHLADAQKHTDETSQRDSQAYPQQQRCAANTSLNSLQSVSEDSFSSLQLASEQPTGSLPDTSASQSSAIVVHKYPIDKQLLLQVRLRQGRLPASVISTPAKPIPVVQADASQLTPMQVGHAAACVRAYNASSTDHMEPAAYKASVYRALQLHDQDAPDPAVGTQQLDVTYQAIQSMNLPQFQSLHPASTQQAPAEDAFAAGLEQHPLADPSIYQHLLSAVNDPLRLQSPPPLPIQEHRLHGMNTDTELDLRSVSNTPHQALQINTATAPHAIAVVQHEKTATDGVQPVPAYAWSTEQLTAIATAAATAAAAAFQWQSAQQHTRIDEHALSVASAPSDIRAQREMTLDDNPSMQLASAGISKNSQQHVAADHAQKGISKCVTEVQEIALHKSVPQQQQQHQQSKHAQQQKSQQAVQGTGFGKQGSLKQAAALSKLKHRTSLLRASTGSLETEKAVETTVITDHEKGSTCPTNAASAPPVAVKEQQVLHTAYLRLAAVVCGCAHNTLLSRHSTCTLKCN